MLDEALARLQEPSAPPEEQLAALTEAEAALAALENPETSTRLQRVTEAAPFVTEEALHPLMEALQRGDLEVAADQLAELLDEEGAPLTAAQMEALAEALTALAEGVGETGSPLAEQFQRAAEALQEGDISEARAALTESQSELRELAANQGANAALQEARAGLQESAGALREASAPGEAASLSWGSSPESSGAGGLGGHEDRGSSAPYGSEVFDRLEGEGGRITLPRAAEPDGDSQQGEGHWGPAQVPYAEVYGEYASAAEAELDRRALPPALRSYIRAYFDALD